MKFDEIVIRRKNKTIYRDGDNCIKVFDEDYSKADVLNEALNNARIENIGLCTPKIKEVMMVDGKWAIVTDFIEGKTLEELMLENPDKIDEYLDIFVDLQIEMHSKKCTSLNRLKDKMRRKIDETTLRMRVYERGSGVTLACGTGACATVAAAVSRGICPPNTPITVLLDGGALTVIHSEGGTTYMLGGAEFAFDGVWEGEI